VEEVTKSALKMLTFGQIETNAAFILNGFNNQERNLTFVKMDFQVLKLKFH